MSAYHVEETDSAARNLDDLLDVICDLQFEGGKEPDSRIDSLLWIARDLSSGIIECLNSNAAAASRRIDA